MQDHIDQQPFVSRLLLIDYAIVNAQAQLTDRKQVATESAAIARLKQNQHIAALFDGN